MQPTDSECIGKAANVLAYFVLAAACAASALASAQGAAKERFAGAVEFLAGDVMIEPLLGAARLPKEGERVQEGDMITTFQSA